MELFRKKKEETKSCCCNGACAPKDVEKAEMEKTTPGIKVLGSGCPRCGALEEAVRSALEDLGLVESIHHVTDFTQIAAYGVMSTPALVIDGRVVSYGKVLSKEEAKALIQKERS